MRKEVLILLAFVLFVPFVEAEADCIFATSSPGPNYAFIQFLTASGISDARLSPNSFPYRIYCPSFGGATKFALIANTTDSVGSRADFGSVSSIIPDSFSNSTFQRPGYPSTSGYIHRDLATFFYDPNVLKHACYVREGGCLPSDSCVMSISADTNATVGDCSVYNSKLCCDVFATVGCNDLDKDGYFGQTYSNLTTCTVSNWDCVEGIYDSGTDTIATDPAVCNPQTNIDCGNPIFSACSKCIHPGAFENTYPLCSDNVDNDCNTLIDSADSSCNIPDQAECGDGVINAGGEQCEYPNTNFPFNDRDLVSCPDFNGIEPLQACNSQCKCEYALEVESGNYSIRFAGECVGIDDNGIGTSQDIIKVFDRADDSFIYEYAVNSTRPCLTSQVDEPFFGINSLIFLITIIGGYYLFFHKKDEV